MKDLTKGRPSVLILTFALPIFLANLLQLTYSLADTRIVGTFLGDNALAAVGATTTLSNLIVQFLMGMCNGFAIISAQCFGAKDMDRLRRSLGNSLVLGLLAAVVLTIGGLVFLQPILRFLNVPENLLNTATQYVSVIIAGLVVTLLYDVLAATLRAIGDTVTPLIVLAVSVVLNIGGDLLLIVVLHMGVLGAAVATVLSQLIAVVVCAIYLWKKYVILRKIGSLVKKGYVEKIQSTTDRREYFLRPTQKYIDYYSISYSYLHTVIERVRKRFPAEDCDKMEQMLSVISTELMPELDMLAKCRHPEAPKSEE